MTRKTKKKLPTLDEHNEEVRNAKKTVGVTCPKCGTELERSPHVNQPNGVYCPNKECIFSGTMLT